MWSRAAELSSASPTRALLQRLCILHCPCLQLGWTSGEAEYCRQQVWHLDLLDSTPRRLTRHDLDVQQDRDQLERPVDLVARHDNRDDILPALEVC